VAHYNHGLRHQESDQDAQFVERLGQELGLTVVCEKNISPLNSSDGVEAAARKARYEFLERTARRFQARWIATAHTADDQTETLVHRLIRGSGTQGLIGIPFVRELADDLRIIRPMLDRTRAEVLQYLEQIGQTFRHDSSNNSFDYTRNRIRHRLIPLLKEENPSIHRTFQKLATQIRELNEIEQWSAKQIYKQVKIQHKEDTLEISRGAFLDCPIAVIRSFWRYFWQKQNWPTAEMTFEHWQRLALACISGELSSTDFPGGIRVKATPKRIKIKRPPPHS
jgi:tRNA(Ile)-lysidine synthase